VQERKAAFNSKLAALRARKQTDTDRLMDLRERVMEITEELGTEATEEALPVPTLHPREALGSVLAVTDDEVPCDRYVSPEDTAAAAAAAAAEAARARGSGGERARETHLLVEKKVSVGMVARVLSGAE